MNEININSLLRDTQVINIKDEDSGEVIKKIEFKKMSVSKSLDITEQYNKIVIGLRKKIKDVPTTMTTEQQMEMILGQDINYSRKYFNQIIELCVQIIRPEKFGKKVKAFFSGNWITKKQIMEQFDAETANNFIQLVLKPIISEKKTMKPAKD